VIRQHIAPIAKGKKMIVGNDKKNQANNKQKNKRKKRKGSNTEEEIKLTYSQHFTRIA